MVLFCGGLFLLAGFLRLGFIAQFISVPVMAGFVFGLAVFVTVSQLPKLFGIEKGDGNTVHQFFYLLGHLGDTSYATFAVGLGALVLLFGIDRYAPRLPGGLLALVLGIAVSAALDLSSHGVAIVGTVPSGLPSVSAPNISAGDVVPPGLLIGVLSMLLLVVYQASRPHIAVLGRVPDVPALG
jgi:sulfate permease, SulP family